MDKLNHVLDVIGSCFSSEQLENALSWGFTTLRKENLDDERCKMVDEIIIYHYNRVRERLTI